MVSTRLDSSVQDDIIYGLRSLKNIQREILRHNSVFDTIFVQ
jgi:hypothetical protein